MKVLIAMRDAVYARMLELEFSERGIDCLFYTGEDDIDIQNDIRLAVIDAGLLSYAKIPVPGQCETVVIGYPEELARIPTQELTRYYAVVRPLVMEDFLNAVFISHEEDNRQELRSQKRKNPSQFLALDETIRAAYYKGEKINLTAKEFALLHLLLENKGKPVSRQEALTAVFGDINSDTNVVDVYVNYLRTKIDNRFRMKLISTVRGCGYMIAD